MARTYWRDVGFFAPLELHSVLTFALTDLAVLLAVIIQQNVCEIGRIRSGYRKEEHCSNYSVPYLFWLGHSQTDSVQSASSILLWMLQEVEKHTSIYQHTSHDGKQVLIWAWKDSSHSGSNSTQYIPFNATWSPLNATNRARRAAL